ncbi:MAG: DUF5689 domain-containing protein [Bacteroidales bacterium]|nr:DUF5689 domain-containing protein [Bacteroidales bacterium]
MKAIKNLSILAVIAVVFTACFNFDEPERFELREPSDRSKIITIDSLKRMLWTLPNSFNPIGQAWEATVWSAEIPYDVYIEGRIISDDRDGNFFNQILIQDSTSGINVRIGRTGLYNFYRRGQTIYVRMQGLTLAFRRGMYEIGDIPDQGYLSHPRWREPRTSNPANFPTTTINIPLFIERHILVGTQAQGGVQIPPHPITLDTFPRMTENRPPRWHVPNNGRYNMVLGTLVKIENVRHVGTNDFFGMFWENIDGFVYPEQISLRLDEEYLRDNPIRTWALTAQDASRIMFREYLDQSFLGERRGPPSNSGLSVTQLFEEISTGEIIRVRTSGFARFAGEAIPEGPMTLIGVLSLNTDRHGSWFSRGQNDFPDYQIALRDLRDVIIP